MLLELIRAFCSIVGLHKGEFLGPPLVAFVVNLAKVKHTPLWHTLLSHCFPYFYLDQSVPSYCCHDVFFPRKALTDHWLVDNFGIITCDCFVSRLERGACIYFGLCNWQSQDRNFTTATLKNLAGKIVSWLILAGFLLFVSLRGESHLPKVYS